MEKIGFFDHTTKIEEIKQRLEKLKKMVEQKDIFKF
jgi:hypothetical protein